MHRESDSQRDSLRPPTCDSLCPVAGETEPNPASPRADRRSACTAVVAIALALLCVASTRHGAGGAPSDSPLRAAAPTIKTSDSGTPQRWHQPDVVIGIDASVDALGPGAADAVQAAFGAWTATDAVLPVFRFERTAGVRLSRSPDGANTVSVADLTIAGHEDDVAITISYADTTTGQILEEDIYLNARRLFTVVTSAHEDRVPWQREGANAVPPGSAPAPTSETCATRYDVQNTVTHEVGHFLGLGEDRSDSNATMFYRLFACDTRKRTVTDDDAAAVRNVYQDGFDQGPTAQCQVARPGSEPGPATPMAACFAAVAGFGAVVRRRARALSPSHRGRA